jgi:hypothetical protein
VTRTSTDNGQAEKVSPDRQLDSLLEEATDGAGRAGADVCAWGSAGWHWRPSRGRSRLRLCQPHCTRAGTSLTAARSWARPWTRPWWRLPRLHRSSRRLPPTESLFTSTIPSSGHYALAGPRRDSPAALPPDPHRRDGCDGCGQLELDPRSARLTFGPSRVRTVTFPLRPPRLPDGPVGGVGLRRPLPAHPGRPAFYAIRIPRCRGSPRASFRPRLAATPLPPARS